MKKLILPMLFALVVGNVTLANEVYSYDESKEIAYGNELLDRFKYFLKRDDVAYLKKHVHYPLELGEFFHIENEQEFVKWYDRIFDSEVKRKVLATKYGWYVRKYNLYNYVEPNGEQYKGALILTEDGSDDGDLMYLSYHSKAVKAEDKRLRELKMFSLHPSLRNFYKQWLEFDTETYHGRLDIMTSYGDSTGHYNLRLCLWSQGRRTVERPDVKLTYYEDIPGGSCGNWNFNFYEIPPLSPVADIDNLYHYDLGYDNEYCDWPGVYLTLCKGDSIIWNEKAYKYK